MKRVISFAVFVLGCFLTVSGCDGSDGSGTTNIVAATPPAVGGGRPAVERQAQFAYPKRLQVNKPSVVRFTIFAPGSEPLTLSNSQLGEKALSIAQYPDLIPYVTVKLDITGADIDKEPEDLTQPLYETSNTWEWRITAQEQEPVSLRPVIHMEYRDADGNAGATYDIAWGAPHTIDKVDGDSSLSVVGGWFGDNLVGLLGIIIGIPGTITTLRTLGKSTHTPQPA
jgi:hypothetical protein